MMLPIGERPEWWDDGVLCRGEDPELFFPQRGAPTAPARAICARCPHCEACREFAIEHRIDTGIWGGTSARERKLAWRERARRARLL